MVLCYNRYKNHIRNIVHSNTNKAILQLDKSGRSRVGHVCECALRTMNDEAIKSLPIFINTVSVFFFCVRFMCEDSTKLLCHSVYSHAWGYRSAVNTHTGRPLRILWVDVCQTQPKNRIEQQQKHIFPSAWNTICIAGPYRNVIVKCRLICLIKNSIVTCLFRKSGNT